MGLEEYSPRKKVFLTIVTLVGAALFTVTGAMMAGVEACSGAQRQNLTTKGDINGEEVSSKLFQARKRIVEGFTSPIVPLLPSSETESEFAKKRMVEGQMRAPLFSLWPRKNDAHVWLFAAAVKEAEAAGIVRPTPHEANAFYFERLTGGSVRYRTGQEMINYYEQQGLEPNSFLAAVSEYMMLQRYIDSINIDAAYQPDPTKSVEEYREHVPNYGAKIASVSVAPFIEEATRLYETRVRADRAEELAALLAGSSASNDYSPEEAVNLVPSEEEKRVLFTPRKVQFAMIRAEYQTIANALASSLSETEKRQFYENRKGTLFRTEKIDQDPDRVEARLKLVESRYTVLPDGWDAEAEKEEMKAFYHYKEREDEIRDLMSRSEAVKFATIAMNDLKRDLDKEIKDETTKIRVASEENGKVGQKYDSPIVRLQTIASTFEAFKRDPVVQLIEALHKHDSTSHDEIMQRTNLVRDLKSALVTPTGSTSSYAKIKDLLGGINLKQIEYEIASLERELSEVRSEIEKRKNDKAFADTPEFLLADKLVQFKLDGKKLELEIATELRAKVVEVESEMEPWLRKLHFQIAAFEASDSSVDAIVAFVEGQIEAYEAKMEQISSSFDLKDRIEALESERNAAVVVPQRAGHLADYKAQLKRYNFNGRASEAIEFPWAGLGSDGKPFSIKLDYKEFGGVVSLRTLKELGPDWNWIANLSDASSFVNGINLNKNSISNVINRPGVGLYLFQIRVSEPEVRYASNERSTLADGNTTAAEKIREFAIQRIARELAYKKAQALREAAAEAGDAESYLASLKDAGSLELRQTGWFGPASRMYGEIEVTTEPARFGAGNDKTRVNAGDVPSSPFFQSLTELTAEKPLSKIFFEAALKDDRVQSLDKERYSFAYVTSRKVDDKALPTNSRDLTSSYTAQIMAQVKKMADKRIIKLISPELLLADTTVEFYPGDYEQPKRSNDDEEEE